MPFGMGPAGWFMWPYVAQWMSYWWPYGGYGWRFPGYGIPYGFPSPYAPMTKEQEMGMLREQAKILQAELDRVNARLKELSPK